MDIVIIAMVASAGIHVVPMLLLFFITKRAPELSKSKRNRVN